MKFLLPLLALVLVAYASPATKFADTSAKCEGCKLGVSAVDSIFKSPEVVKNLITIFNDHVCDALPDADQQKQCHLIVNEYTAQLMGFLAQVLSTETLCVSTGVCQSFLDYKRVLFNEAVPSAGCEGCNLGLSAADAIFKSKDVQDNLLALVDDHICALLGEKETECKEICGILIPTLMQTLADQVLNPAQVCADACK